MGGLAVGAWWNQTRGGTYANGPENGAETGEVGDGGVKCADGAMEKLKRRSEGGKAVAVGSRRDRGLAVSHQSLVIQVDAGDVAGGVVQRASPPRRLAPFGVEGGGERVGKEAGGDEGSRE